MLKRMREEAGGVPVEVFLPRKFLQSCTMTGRVPNGVQNVGNISSDHGNEQKVKTMPI
jgi:hypothetical protein